MENTQIQPIHIEDELKASFLDYSMSVIVSRALPDVRDGLKPVHRRILYAMNLLKNFHNRPYLKSARIVGEVIGRFHPHGDSAVYDALVRMAQNFSMRYPLVDGQGNFGSVDGDSPAAMRYTEVRLKKLSDLLLEDIEKETVDFGPNYDNKEVEPLVLPTKVPSLLVNGASGIAVGMATNVPPHNMTEIIDALLALIEDEDLSFDRILEIVQGPDFPTRGIIHGRAGIIQAMMTGRGSVVMRARAEVEDMSTSGRQRIIVTELPYQVNKAKLLEKIADLVRNKKIEGISDLRDESAQEDIRVVIELRKGEQGEIILNNLYKLTPLQSTFGINTVALVNGIPKLLNIKEVLESFYQHRREVIIRRTAYELRKSEEKAHILLGLKTAVENVDDVVQTIRSAADSKAAHEQLVAKYDLSDIQAKAILDMRLARLTGLERDKIVADYQEIMEVIRDLRDILDTPQRVTNIIKDELIALREEFGDERATEIVASDADELTMEALVADEDVAVTITHAGYIKRTPIDEIRAQKRGGKGRSGMKTKSEDLVHDIFIASNHQSLLCFTNQGRVYDKKVYRIPEVALAGRGTHFANLIKLNEGEKVVSVLPVKEFSEGTYVVSVTANGYVKKTDLMSYNKLRSSGIIGLKLEEGDRLVSCMIACDEDHLLIATKLGKAIRFPVKDIRAMGRSARGVTGIKFSEDGDNVIGLTVLNAVDPILSVCENGYGKRTPLEEYRVQTRAGKGIYTIKVTERNGPVVGTLQVSPDDHIMVMTSSGKVMRFTVDEVGVIGRLTQGVRLMNVDEGEKIISLTKITMIEGQEV
ncbi:DNA gyrase subunit A [Pseudobacteriovorax antillogorgiicola]|uniref:DNA gyrase subunit A n=1 Tax=Pseudobacteriovorax antillogorgiicola TaxID=1513793 RepID=A0A1Y6B8N2_9BACT|nr:DNA gyrase subunit A [Pseudobacteriovorax antillogorgiicola]TCS59143.1 DNA gyrase subunit A [Pseudobacteriovorax antillogorgiicola]SME91263.1 DNA gyrase subunit A [Pseudobacteriovorax antillogorgiicola]